MHSARCNLGVRHRKIWYYGTVDKVLTYLFAVFFIVIANMVPDIIAGGWEAEKM